jgi:hypothetical protein
LICLSDSLATSDAMAMVIKLNVSWKFMQMIVKEHIKFGSATKKQAYKVFELHISHRRVGGLEAHQSYPIQTNDPLQNECTEKVDGRTSWSIHEVTVLKTLKL